MSPTVATAIAKRDLVDAPVSIKQAQPTSIRLEALSNQNQDEVLAFLSRRPLHTVFMAGLIRDNGLISYCNRGTFCGYRDAQSRLCGVALIGQKTLIEASNKQSFETFASLVPGNNAAHLIRGEQRQIESLLDYYAAKGRVPRLLRRELLLEQTASSRTIKSESNLRIACAADLESVVSINAALAFEENGIDPRQTDPNGLWERTARRIAQGRVWVLSQCHQIIFKADVISETPQTAFVEGVYVLPEQRRRGHGLRCMTQLARQLLNRSASICLVVNEENLRARVFYSKAGFSFSSNYNTAYFSAK
jgi:uncharacterized protein